MRRSSLNSQPECTSAVSPTTPLCWCLMRGDSMEKFYQMQIEEGGIVGPEGPGEYLPIQQPLANH